MNCIVVVFGTRPEFIKLFPVIEQLKRIKDTDVIIINANQQPNLLEPLLKHFKFEADHTLEGVNGSDLLESVQKITNQLNEIIKSIRLGKEIDFILAQGDTNTVLAASIAGRYNGIKFSHLEAGLRSFSDNDPYPEEMNRKLVGHNAFVHFAPDKMAVANLKKEGINDNIVLTGNTIVDFLKGHYKKSKTKRDTVLITLHRRNNKDYRSKKILNICIGLATRYLDHNFLWVQHPSAPDAKQAELLIPNFRSIQPLNPEELLKLYNRTAIIITDSGGMQEEGISLGIPVLVTRNFTERQSGIIKKKSFLTGSAGERLESLFEKVISKWNYSEDALFGGGKASVKIREWFEKYFKEKKIYDVAFLGFGPAGSGVIINMLQRDQITRLKKKKVVILDKSDSILKGNITSYYINSDTYAKTFTEFADNVKDLTAKKLANKSSYKKLKGIDGNVALKNVDAFLSDASALYTKVIGKLGNINLRNKEIAQRIIQSHSGIFKIKSIANTSSFFSEHEYHAKKIVMACGGIQNRVEILNRQIGRSSLNLLNHAGKVIYTDDLFRGKQNENLKKLKKPSILIIGSSHSAFTSAIYLKKFFQENNIYDYNVRIIYRSMPKPFFLTLEDAHKNGFTNYGQDDTCPLTGRVNRLSGLRFEARELFMDLLKEGKVNGVELGEIPSNDNKLREILDQANSIIPAFGYVPNAVEVIDPKGEPVKLNIGIGKNFVNDKCQVLDAEGNVVENIFGIGLASGFVPSGKLGGERNFKGQTNGYWLYQNGVGEIIADQIF